MTIASLFNLQSIHPSWRDVIQTALGKMKPDYLHTLIAHSDWLPGQDNIFNAFTLPINQVNYVLLGESPYPRAKSANGYAFWDQAVTTLWSDTGLSKSVNRATSLRNIIKMLLIAENYLEPGKTTQPDIACLNKENLVGTNQEFFTNLLRHGFLLLNASLVLQQQPVRKDAAAWLPFIQHVLLHLIAVRPDVQLVLFGKIANMIEALTSNPSIKKVVAEHPYNISFIHNPGVIRFFQPMHLLIKNDLQSSKSHGKLIVMESNGG